MDKKYKNVVESMVDTYLSDGKFSDIIKDKGRGLVVLLHGGPGTGKTLTAGELSFLVLCPACFSCRVTKAPVRTRSGNEGTTAVHGYLW